MAAGNDDADEIAVAAGTVESLVAVLEPEESVPPKLKPDPPTVL